MLLGRIISTIYFGGNCYSISTLRNYCCIGGAFIMPRSYYSSRRACSNCRPKTVGGTSLWASSGASPDFSRQLCEQTVLRLMCRGSHAVFIVASVQSCHAVGGFTLTATLITSGCTAILTNMGDPTLCFRATTFVVLGHFYQRYDGSLNVIEVRFQLIFKRSCRRGHDRRQNCSVDTMQTT